MRHERARNTGNSLFGKVSGYFSSRQTESLNFQKHVRNKPMQVIYPKEKIAHVLDTFDEDDMSRVLVVYIHSELNPSNIWNYIYKRILNSPELSMFINSNFTFYPILSKSKGINPLKKYYGSRDVPSLLFFRWSLQNELKLLRIINLKTRPAPDVVMENMSNVLDLAQDQLRSERGLLGEIEKKKKKLESLQVEHQKKMNELLNNQKRSHQNSGNQYFCFRQFNSKEQAADARGNADPAGAVPEDAARAADEGTPGTRAAEGAREGNRKAAENDEENGIHADSGEDHRPAKPV